MHSSELFANSAHFSVEDAREYLTNYSSYFTWKGADETILEVGCADGFITRNVLYPYVERYLKELRAVDIDQDVIKLAKAHNDSPKLKFSCMNISDQLTASTFKNNYDHIFSLYCFHWVPDLKWVNTTYTMLKSGGQLFASILVSSPFHTVINMQTMENKKWSKFLSLEEILLNLRPEPEDYIRKLLIDAGYKVDVVQVLKRRMTFTSIQNIKDVYASANVFVKRIPDDILDDYIADYENKVLTLCKKSNDNLYYSHQDVAIVIATK